MEPPSEASPAESLDASETSADLTSPRTGVNGARATKDQGSRSSQSDGSRGAGRCRSGSFGRQGQDCASSSSRPSSKSAPTNKRDQPAKPERTTPPKFVRQSIGELHQVVYPTGQQLINYFIVVLVFVLFVIALRGLLDLGLGWVIFRIFKLMTPNETNNGDTDVPENFSAEEPQQDAEPLESLRPPHRPRPREDFDIDLGSYSAVRGRRRHQPRQPAPP